MLKNSGIWICRLKERSHSPEEEGDSWRNRIWGEKAEEASAPELFPHTGHWPGEARSGSGGSHLRELCSLCGMGRVFSVKSGCQGGAGVRVLKQGEKSVCFLEEPECVWTRGRWKDTMWKEVEKWLWIPVCVGISREWCPQRKPSFSEARGKGMGVQAWIPSQGGTVSRGF